MPALPSLMPSPLAHYDVEALRDELNEARGAQQTAEIALAHEREANISEAVRAAINDAIRGQREALRERDRARFHLEQSHRALRGLKRELVDTLRQNRALRRKNKELVAIQPRLRYSPFADHSIRYRRSSFPTARYRTHTPTPKSPHTFTRLSTPSPSGIMFESQMIPPEEESQDPLSDEEPTVPSWSSIDVTVGGGFTVNP